MFSGSTTSWDVPPGTDYTIESSVFNYNSNYYTGPGDPTATGAFGAFDIAPYESVDATIVNLPNSTIPLTDETYSSLVNEPTGGERWFSVATGAFENALYVEVYSYGNTGASTFDVDMDLYVFDDTGNLLVFSDNFSDGNTASDDFEFLSAEDTVQVNPSSTYYIGIYAYEGGDFVVFADSSVEPVTFAKPSYADPTLAANQDRITATVWITRGDAQGLYNAYAESASDGFLGLTPTGTEWAPTSTSNVLPGDYTTWGNAVGWNPPSSVGNTYSLHLISDDLYFDVTFLSWSSGGTGGGFSYHRLQVPGL